MHQYATLEDTVYLYFGANDTSGSGADGATPVFDVRLGGAAAGAAPILSGSATLLSHADYPAGCHEVAIAATAGNGFAAGNTYAVFCTLLVDSQNPTGFVGSFTLGPVPANAIQVNSNAAAAANLKLACDNYSATRGLTGTAVPAAAADAAGGLPISDAGGLDLDNRTASAAAVTVLNALMTVATISGAVDDVAATSTEFDTDLAEASDDHYNGGVIVFLTGNLAGEGRRISDYAGSGGHVTLTPALTEAPANTDTFIILGRIEA